MGKIIGQNVFVSNSVKKKGQLIGMTVSPQTLFSSPGFITLYKPDGSAVMFVHNERTDIARIDMEPVLENEQDDIGQDKSLYGKFASSLLNPPVGLDVESFIHGKLLDSGVISTTDVECAACDEEPPKKRAEMPKYVCSEEVFALQIKHILPRYCNGNPGEVDGVLSRDGVILDFYEIGYKPVVADQEWVDKNNPSVGDYLVQHMNGVQEAMSPMRFEQTYRHKKPTN